MINTKKNDDCIIRQYFWLLNRVQRNDKYKKKLIVSYGNTYDY